MVYFNIIKESISENLRVKKKDFYCKVEIESG